MEERMKKFVFGFLALPLLLAGCAKREDASGGTIVVYSTQTENDLDSLVKGFGEKYPDITLEIVNGSTGELLSRIAAEENNPQADVMWGGLNAGDGDVNRDLFEPWVSENEKDLMDGYTSPNGFYNLSQLQTVCFVVNNDLEKELGLNIKGYADLLNPALKGKIVTADPNSSSSAWSNLSNIMAAYGNNSPEAWDLIEKLMRNGLVIVNSSSMTFKGPVDGEYVVGLSYDDGAASLLKSGAKNVRLVYPAEGTSAMGFGSAIVKNAPHLKEAQALVNYLTSTEGQAYLGTAIGTLRGTNKLANYNSPYIAASSDIKWVMRDIPWLIQNRTQILDRWNQLVVSIY
jgi:iron(III) transport system substrate-binding protein